MSDEFDFNDWAQPDNRPKAEIPDDGECQTVKSQESRSWDRTVLVPDGMNPIDILEHYSRNLPLPPFHALQLTVNKRDVECIASAMANPNLRWRNLYHFTIAPYDGHIAELRGQWVLISGHHRFLAFLLSGVAPSSDCPLKLTKAPLAMSLFTWKEVIWGK